MRSSQTLLRTFIELRRELRLSDGWDREQNAGYLLGLLSILNMSSSVTAEFEGGEFGLIFRFVIRERAINVRRKSFQE